MGRKSKLKQMRQQAKTQRPTEPTAPSTDFAPTEFVQQLEQIGYQLNQEGRSPDLPNHNVSPQL
jgi:hypothetical protein